MVVFHDQVPIVSGNGGAENAVPAGELRCQSLGLLASIVESHPILKGFHRGELGFLSGFVKLGKAVLSGSVCFLLGFPRRDFLVRGSDVPLVAKQQGHHQQQPGDCVAIHECTKVGYGSASSGNLKGRSYQRCPSSLIHKPRSFMACSMRFRTHPWPPPSGTTQSTTSRTSGAASNGQLLRPTA